MKPETEIQIQEAGDFGILEHMKLKYYIFCGQLIQTSFYPGVLVTHTGEWEIGSASGWLGDNPEELA